MWTVSHWHRLSPTVALAALPLAGNTGNRRIEADALNVLVTIYASCGQRQRAIDLNRQALDLALGTGGRCTVIDSHIGLADSLRGIGRATGGGLDAASDILATLNLTPPKKIIELTPTSAA